MSKHVVFHHSISKQGSTGSFTTGLCAKRYFRASWESDHLLASGAARKRQRCGHNADLHCPERLCRTGTSGHGEDCICVNVKCWLCNTFFFSSHKYSTCTHESLCTSYGYVAYLYSTTWHCWAMHGACTLKHTNIDIQYVTYIFCLTPHTAASSVHAWWTHTNTHAHTLISSLIPLSGFLHTV